MNIYAGIGTATEAAAFGAFGALVIGLSMKKTGYKKHLRIVNRHNEANSNDFYNYYWCPTSSLITLL